MSLPVTALRKPSFCGRPFPAIIAAHESPRTTKLYDRTNDEITLDEIERILI